MSLRIGVDLDGVLADFVGGFNALIKDTTGKIMPAIATSWNWHIAAGVTLEENNQLWRLIEQSDYFCEFLNPLPTCYDDLALLTKLADEGHQIYFITSRPGRRVQQQSSTWLDDYGYYFPPAVLLATSVEDKATLAEGLHLDLFIDDRPENILAVAETQARCYLKRAPYNTAYADVANGFGYEVADSVTDMMNQWLARNREINEQRRAA